MVNFLVLSLVELGGSVKSTALDIATLIIAAGDKTNHRGIVLFNPFRVSVRI
jgi:hypothetical protein